MGLDALRKNIATNRQWETVHAYLPVRAASCRGSNIWKTNKKSNCPQESQTCQQWDDQSAPLVKWINHTVRQAQRLLNLPMDQLHQRQTRSVYFSEHHASR